MAESTGPMHYFPETSAANAMINSSFERHSLIQAFLSICFFGRWEPQAIRSWLPLLSELPAKADFDPLRESSLALATLMLGRDSQDYSLVHLSLKCYTRGLHQLRKALRHPSLMKEDGTLAACMALSLYETIECPSQGSGGYFSHCHGLLAMIQARGVERHASGPGHRLFLGIRVPGVSSMKLRCIPEVLTLTPNLDFICSQSECSYRLI